MKLLDFTRKHPTFYVNMLLIHILIGADMNSMLVVMMKLLVVKRVEGFKLIIVGEINTNTCSMHNKILSNTCNNHQFPDLFDSTRQ